MEHCPTLEMLADFFTKPLQQDHRFRRFRDVLLGTSHVNTLAAPMMESIEERVEGIRMGPHKTAATGVVNTGTGTLKDLSTGVKSSQRSERRAPQNVTWANIARRVPKSTELKGGVHHVPGSAYIKTVWGHNLETIPLLKLRFD